MKTKIVIAACAMAMGMAAFSGEYVAASAQTTAQTTFMLENNYYNYRYNPAFTPRKAFFGLGISNITPSLQSNVGISNFLFPTDNGLVTGLNSAISSEEFLGGLKDMNRISTSVDENILAIGFKGKNGGYSTIELNVCADARVALPYDMFSFLKDAGAEKYDLSKTDVGASAWAELAYGYSRKIGDHFGIGVRLKALVGLARVDTDIRQFELSSNSTAIKATTDASIMGACAFMDVATKQSEYDATCNDVLDFSAMSFDKSNIKPSGYGAAIDLGAYWTPIDDLEVSLALNNIGGLVWKYNIIGTSNGEATFSGAELNTNSNSGSSSSLSDELNNALDELKELAEFHKSDESSNAFKALPFTANAAVRYHLPFYRRLTFGATASYSIATSPVSNSFSARAGAAITPLDWISLTGNVGITNYGPVWGAAFSIGQEGIDFYVALDGFMGQVAHAYTKGDSGMKIPYPISRFGTTLSLGLVVPL